MKTGRQEEILRIIEHQDIETQEELAARLREKGYKVTQATVSRDIKELIQLRLYLELSNLHVAYENMTAERLAELKRARSAYLASLLEDDNLPGIETARAKFKNDFILAQQNIKASMFMIFTGFAQKQDFCAGTAGINIMLTSSQ